MFILRRYTHSALFFFPNLTHLEIRLPSGDRGSGSWENCDVLAQFPKLTHVSVKGTIRSQDVLKLLQDRSTFPLLELLVVVPVIPFHQRQDLEARAKVYCSKLKDKRLVVLAKTNLLDAIPDWERGANGGVDM